MKATSMGLKNFLRQLFGVLPDAEIAAAVEQRLVDAFGDRVSDLEVTVSDRQVVLTGRCRDIAIKQRAMTEALSITGVHGVINEIRVDL